MPPPPARKELRRDGLSGHAALQPADVAFSPAEAQPQRAYPGQSDEDYEAMLHERFLNERAALEAPRAYPGQSDEDYDLMLSERSLNEADAAQQEQYSPEAAAATSQSPSQHGEMKVQGNASRPGWGSLGPQHSNQGEAGGEQPDRGYLARIRDALEALDVMLSRDMSAPNEIYRDVNSEDGEPSWEEVRANPQPEWSPDVPALNKTSAPGEPTREEMFAPARSKYDFKERVPRKKETF